MKYALRQQARVARKSLTLQEKKIKSQRIQQRVQSELHTDVTIFLYQACADEVQTNALFQYITQPVFAPVTQRDASMTWFQVDAHTQWKTGVYPISEPVSGHLWRPSEKPVVIICPLLAFDRHGHRLGQGLGCYDRWLGHYHQYVQQVIGLAFACQEVRNVPHEGHDHPIDMIITEDEVIRISV